MDDCDGPMTYIPPSCKVSVQKVDSSVLTEPRKLCDQSTTTQHCINHGVQTDHMPTVQSTITDVKISEDVINLVLTALKANIEEQNVLARLDILHRTDFVTLSVITQFQVPQREDLPLHSAVCGPNGRTAFLFGHHYHETWCPHNGVVVFWQRRFIDRMVLSTCPTILRYGPQGLVAIGLVTGHILIALNGECLSTKEAHTLTVTSLEWLPSLRPQLVSVSLDGKIIIHSLKSTSLEEKHFRLVTISDLPRNIKRSNSSTRYTGLTSLCLVKDKLFVGNELGAIWSVTLPDLTLSLFHYEIDCIEMLAYVSNHLLIITSFGQGLIISRNGATVRILEDPVQNVVVTKTNFLIFSNYTRIFVTELESSKRLMEKSIAHLSIALVPEDNALLIVDQQLNATIYKINNN